MANSADPFGANRSFKISPTVFGFFSGGLAACGAVTFTNPMEVVKTRLQLQGEHSVRPAVASSAATAQAAAPKIYRGTFSTFGLIFRNEGLAGLQKGLGAAYVYQLLLNGTRLGLYTPIKHTLTQLFPGPDARRPPGSAAATNRSSINVCSGMLAGVAGAFMGSPIYLIKTRMQSYSTQAAVGHQHHYTGTWSALRHILRQDGLRGLFRGVDAAMIRTGAGSAVQLSTYDLCKHTLLRIHLPASGGADGAAVVPLFRDDIYMHSVAALMTGLLVCLVMNPFDVVSTRMYNQKTDARSGRGSLYRSPLDCLVKTFRAEGYRAFFKAIVPQYIRLGPHTILMFVFMEQIKGLGQRWEII
ncbi:mitochondrial carrier domain-containing protein [Dimargaris cristalligena]|uniref:Mitochondrial carrier domain-containing protein n=1 Tax=Dimargaris cristalligena TaxID=215637 RepID=A0A4P9ZV94_9FUNG|nr:mitochondrial carrier domain-containing protein [Dimargaris cristalligena]|eukprot:RKP36752.1 mitochondrial carrier domain-containing protein [Dimargaris cristalligena]